MKMPNLSEIMVSITDFKKELSEIIKQKQTKVIVKNNEPVSIIMPYEDYVSGQQAIQATGDVIRLSNGVDIKVLVEEENGAIVTKTYLKMKNSNEFKLHFTHSMSNPSVEQTLTNEELFAQYDFNKKP